MLQHLHVNRSRMNIEEELGALDAMADRLLATQEMYLITERKRDLHLLLVLTVCMREIS